MIHLSNTGGSAQTFSKIIPTLILVLLVAIFSACQKDDSNNEDQDQDDSLAPVPGKPVTQTGIGATGDIFHVDINEDGRFICFTTKTALTPDDNDNFIDVYRYDRVAGNLELVSTNLVSNAFTASMTADGTTILYTASQHPDLPNTPTAIYYWKNGAIQTVTEGQQDPNSPIPLITPLASYLNVISPDGRYIAASVDLNLFVYEIATQTSIQLGNGDPVEFSADGSILTFLLVDILSPQTQPMVWYWERSTNSSLPITKSTKYSDNPRISGDGHYIVFASEDGTFTGANDNNGLLDAFLFDRLNPRYDRLSSPNANGESNHPDISSDGKVVVFSTTANSLGVQDNNLFWDIYVRINGQLRNLTNGADGSSVYPLLSADGKYVVFVSESTEFGGKGNNQGANLYIAGPLR